MDDLAGLVEFDDPPDRLAGNFVPIAMAGFEFDVPIH